MTVHGPSNKARGFAGLASLVSSIPPYARPRAVPSASISPDPDLKSAALQSATAAPQASEIKKPQPSYWSRGRITVSIAYSVAFLVVIEVIARSVLDETMAHLQRHPRPHHWPVRAIRRSWSLPRMSIFPGPCRCPIRPIWRRRRSRIFQGAPPSARPARPRPSRPCRPSPPSLHPRCPQRHSGPRRRGDQHQQQATNPSRRLALTWCSRPRNCAIAYLKRFGWMRWRPWSIASWKHISVGTTRAWMTSTRAVLDTATSVWRWMPQRRRSKKDVRESRRERGLWSPVGDDRISQGLSSSSASPS
jgi:hypothetical protein